MAKKSPLTASARFVASCSRTDLDSFYLARLEEVANARKDLHEVLDRLIEKTALANIAQWFVALERAEIERAPDSLEQIMAWAQTRIRTGQNGGRERDSLPSVSLGRAHRVASSSYQRRNLAEGKCCVCPAPLAPHSVRYCVKHLAMALDRYYRKKGGRSEPGSLDWLYAAAPSPSTHGRQPGSVKALAQAREKRGMDRGQGG